MENETNNNEVYPVKPPREVLLTTEQAAAAYYQPAGFFTRLLAGIIDQSLFLVTVIPGLPKSIELLIILFSLIYNVAFLTIFGATIGKMLLKIRVVDKNYDKLSFPRVLLRETVGKFLSGLLFSLGYLWILWDREKRGWHDKIAQSYVIHTRVLTKEEYEQEIKKSELPLGLKVAGFGELLIFMFLAFTIIPSLVNFYSTLEAGFPSFYVAFLVFAVFFSAVQVIYGFVLSNRQQASGNIGSKQKVIAAALLVFGTLLFLVIQPLILFAFVFPPIYSIK